MNESDASTPYGNNCTNFILAFLIIWWRFVQTLTFFCSNHRRKKTGKKHKTWDGDGKIRSRKTRLVPFQHGK
jgi:hypothetical protein